MLSPRTIERACLYLAAGSTLKGSLLRDAGVSYVDEVLAEFSECVSDSLSMPRRPKEHTWN
jgi:hypothetical protein